MHQQQQQHGHGRERDEGVRSVVPVYEAAGLTRLGLAQRDLGHEGHQVVACSACHGPRGTWRSVRELVHAGASSARRRDGEQRARRALVAIQRAKRGDGPMSGSVRIPVGVPAPGQGGGGRAALLIMSRVSKDARTPGGTTRWPWLCARASAQPRRVSPLAAGSDPLALDCGQGGAAGARKRARFVQQLHIRVAVASTDLPRGSALASATAVA